MHSGEHKLAGREFFPVARKSGGFTAFFDFAPKSWKSHTEEPIA